ncbi:MULTISPECIES: 1,4-alpha-glucan branching protein GlgB [unclassified Pseudoalteromonas]|uniref:1,4-alpha-glucan branching protein GlgB n=1 Tax=unclassified Pseudoalteromonas TaxID=194690 RepID=UPI001F2D63F8|nr:MULTISPECIES: 1,4-alpha-glucan branching protein GlgB [unclassified Pseudoalteromonas]MCF2826236.1 1,4-alpha-glucan branching protein GlgB [Pseudoalteromonas sp. OF5H-5]MCF2830252.1 1,4-alpha-glucan branching protein GlgB [Pseudoalteromonas sp. DL2-H6]MCF2925496.1 1,4-alpha-glucan branching protein GlgB [Pseudoalteromonas sp. DL2-H1]
MNTRAKIEDAQVDDYISQLAALEAGKCRDPFAFLGLHQLDAKRSVVRCFIPGATEVKVLTNNSSYALERFRKSALFTLDFKADDISKDYLLEVHYPEQTVTGRDVYSFESCLADDALYLFNEGTQAQAYLHLGSHQVEIEGVIGFRFGVWAPNALSVSVIGEFNHWQAVQHPMRLHPASGVWELFIPALEVDCCYKFAITTFEGERIEKADPFAFKMEQAPGTASITQARPAAFTLSQADHDKKALRNKINAPISIYEVHLGSWKRREKDGNRYLTYRELADDLIPYVKALGFTHLQLMPISEYPFDGSWGYQPVGLFSPTSRFGGVEDFAYFVECCHREELGLLIDWVPGHFPSDPHGLHKFDGTHLFEHADKRQGFHPDWNTYIFNYDRAEVKSFLLSNAMYWIKEYAIDGLRVDAVASMLYLDYSRKHGEWVPNQYGGRENLGAIECLKSVNTKCYGVDEGIMMVAEESTAWPGVTRSVEHDGLGFGYKWNMGWMNDTLNYMSKDPIHRKYHHHEMTFSMVYAYSENYILPLSHDEVVHGKGALLSKMPGDDWQQFANLRAYYGFMFAHPGKKLLFMGAELAPREEWDHNQQLNWKLLESEAHQGVYKCVKALNTTYKSTPQLFECDSKSTGFNWIDGGNAEQSIFSFVRYGQDGVTPLVVIANFTPQTHFQFRLGVPSAGVYQVILNTDDKAFWGSGVGVVAHKQQLIESKSIASHGLEQSIDITVPPLATVYLQLISGGTC